MQQNPARPWKTHRYFSNPPVFPRYSIRSHEWDLVETQDFASLPHNPIHHAPKGDFHSSSGRRAPLGMMTFSERSQIAVGARNHNFAAVVVNEEIVVLRPFARPLTRPFTRKIDHHLG